MTGVTQSRVLVSEWRKLRTLRSSWITLLVAFGLIVGLGLLVSAVTVSNWSHVGPEERASFDPVERSIGGLYLGQLAFLVLGVLFITGEYSTGMVRATFAAVPKRLPVLWAKLLVFLAVTLVLGTIACLLAFFGGQAIFAGRHLDTTLGAPGVARSVFGGGLYLCVIGLLGVSIGFLLRNTAGGIATMAAMMFVLPPLVDLLPHSWSTRIGPYLPTNAGADLFVIHTDPYALAPWTGFAVLCAYAVVAAAAAAVMLVRRDV
jgi:hypothetical protein